MSYNNDEFDNNDENDYENDYNDIDNDDGDDDDDDGNLPTYDQVLSPGGAIMFNKAGNDDDDDDQNNDDDNDDVENFFDGTSITIINTNTNNILNTNININTNNTKGTRNLAAFMGLPDLDDNEGIIIIIILFYL